MFIPDEKVEEIRSVTDIVDVVSDYVRLKKRGSNFVGLCPFHAEKTPSFNVNPGMGIFKCFGCSVGGDVYQFLMRVEKLGFPEAVRMLAERAGIPLPEEDDQREQSNEIEEIYHALRFAARFFFQQLTQEDAGRPALAYIKKRGLSGAMVKKFGLGYAPDAWDALLREAERQPIAPETLEKAGLVIPRKDGSGYYDRYRARLIFPIFSHVGKVLGFGGRILEADSKQPKYINSPETQVYHKSRVLYGLYQGKQEVRQREEVILVEGYTDVISLHQAGVEHVVASSGTALTEEQVKTLGRYAKRVLLLYDADAAGAGAALRGIDLVLSQGLSAYAVALPGGEDPDSFVQREGGAGFEAFVEKQRQDFVAFLYAQARRSGDLDTPEGKAETQRSIVQTVGLIPDPLMRESYLRRASEVLDVPDMQLRQVLDAFLKDRQRVRHRPSSVQPPPLPEASSYGLAPEEPDSMTLEHREPLPEEKTLLRLMLAQGTSMVEYILGNMGMDEFTEGPARDSVAHLLKMYEEGRLEPRRFLDGSLGAAVQNLAAEVLTDALEPSENWARKQNITVPRLHNDPYESAASAMMLLKLDRVNDVISRLKERIYLAAQHGQDVRSLQEEMMQLHELRKLIQNRAFLEES